MAEHNIGVYTAHMYDAFQHLVLLLFDLGILALGRFMVRHPERIFHFFTFGIQPEQKFGVVGFFRVAGWYSLYCPSSEYLCISALLRTIC
jgi:hypothetical protein